MGELYGDIGTVVGPHKCDKDARIAELEAENELVKADFDRVQRQCKHEKIRAEAAEAALAERDRMLQLAYEMEELPAEWDPEGYAIWLADLSARAQE